MAGRRSAVAVGINRYHDPRVQPDLNGAESDAKEVFARLQKFGGFDVDKSKHLLLGEAAKSENIRRAISDLFWKKDECDIAVFYFSGHGFLDDYGNGYIAPWDHEYADPLVYGIRMQELREYFLAENNKTEALLILDCCHSGVTAQKPKGPGGSADLQGRFYDSLTADRAVVMGSGKFILASSGADQKSREMCEAHKIRVLDMEEDDLECDDLKRHDHGVMTYYLLEGMNGDAAEGDEVRIGKLYEYVTSRVNKYRDDGHDDFKIYDCVCSTYEEGPASQTVLLRAPSKSKVEQLLMQATVSLSEVCRVLKRDAEQAASGRFPQEVVYPASLLDAIQSVDEALRLSPHIGNATALAGEIDKKLLDYKAYVDVWLLRQKRQYLRPTFKDEFDQLETVVSNLCFDVLRKLEVEQGNLVMDLMRLAVGEDKVEPIFRTDLLKGPFSRARSKAGLTGAVPAAGGQSR